MDRLRGFVAAVDALNRMLGEALSWLTLGTVLVCFAVVVLRYGFGIGFVWMQELYVWQHALVFMLGAGYTLLHNGHVRVDVFYGRAGGRRRAWIDITGTLVFLLPWLAVLAWESAPFIGQSWTIREASQQTGGLPGYFLLKSAVWAFCLLLGLQGVALIARRALYLAGDARYTPHAGTD
ncbi:TRAP transporter small permease subunit [Rhodospirillum centenum]|uniref:TRAP transporter small permease protein n=1 Tax=Rhodospirillum centenum (strain ATCC 51521 / SW) TaxID=414684 RepID=B6IMY2_RHOCS|nr:TRAP transporter small permease subunit [Rhodospirillum centenum]ACI98879.1 TRAP transporter, DctQ-like membrane protein, putative [Rhodospirillum centenum SW]